MTELASGARHSGSTYIPAWALLRGEVQPRGLRALRPFNLFLLDRVTFVIFVSF